MTASTSAFEQASAQGPSAPTDEEVVVRVLSGETALFEVLMRRHNQRVYRAIRAILSSESEVEDVMQQAYISAYANLARFEGHSRFSTWLLRIAVNEALGRLRHYHRWAVVDPSSEEGAGMIPISSPSPTPEERAGTRELVALLESAIDQLPPIYRQALVLREVEGLDTASTAEALGVSEDVVKTRLHRARALLKETLTARIGSAASEAFSFHANRCDRVVAAVLAKISR